MHNIADSHTIQKLTYSCNVMDYNSKVGGTNLLVVPGAKSCGDWSTSVSMGAGSFKHSLLSVDVDVCDYVRTFEAKCL